MVLDGKHDDVINAAEALSKELQPLLAGQPPDVVASALADVASIFFAGHNPTFREEAIELWIALMRNLIPTNETAIKLRTGFSWDDQNEPSA